MPGAADTAWVVNGGTCYVTALVNASCGTLAVGGAGSGNVQLNSPFGSLTVGSGGELIGNNGSGQFGQSAGASSVAGNIYLGYNAVSSGTYGLSAGSITVSGNLNVGNSGSGTFIQNGGNNSVTNNVYLGTNAGGSGSYNLSGSGYVATPNMYVGYSGSGAFTQNGGTNNVTNTVYMGYSAASSGSYSLNGGFMATAGNLVIGYSGNGSFTQSGGMNATNSTSGNVFLGYNNMASGSYNLTGGTVSTAYENLGHLGNGSVTQSGGVNLVTVQLNVGQFNYGTYNLSSSGVLSAPQEDVPNLGFSYGAFTQSGGSNLISGSLFLGNGGDSTGSYNLNGGLLRLSFLGEGSTMGTFIFSGGTMQLEAGFATSLYSPIPLNVPGGFGTLDTYGNSVTITANTLTGPGGMNKAGAGTLILNGTQSYTGPTSVSGGTLEVPYDIPSTSSFTAASGGILQFLGTTLNLGSRVVQAMAGGSVVYQNATVSGGYLFGPGTHILPAGSATTFNTTAINPGSIVQQAGSDTFLDVTDRGTMAANGLLTILGGINDGGANMTVNGTADVSSWSNAGVITVTGSGLLNNHVSDLTSYGGARIYVNSGGTLNANSQGEGTALDLQDSLLVNNGRVTGTTNVYYGATVSGSGSFGPINVLQAGAVVVATTAVPAPTSLTVTSGSISGAGNLAVSATVADAILATPNLTDVLTLSGNLSGPGPITKIGAGTLILSGTQYVRHRYDRRRGDVE